MCPQEPDETLKERLWGLTEMFPERLRTVCGAVTSFSVSSVQNIYQFSCNASWIFFTSSMILFAPIIFETERANFMESQRAQQKQVNHCGDIQFGKNISLIVIRPLVGSFRARFSRYVSTWRYASTTTNGNSINRFFSVLCYKLMNYYYSRYNIEDYVDENRNTNRINHLCNAQFLIYFIDCLWCFAKSYYFQYHKHLDF